MKLGPIRQIAYFVPDIRKAATAHAERFGSGPYIVNDNILVQQAWYRGEPCLFDHSSAYGQWGEIMIEFAQQNNIGPSPFHDLYPEESKRFGLHHVAVFVEDLGRAIEECSAQGFETALYAKLNDDFAFAMIDTVAAYGHMVELYEPVDMLIDFYATVRQAAADYGGQRPILTL